MPMVSGARISFTTFATSYGSGPFHPAIQTGKEILYWPNRTFETEELAYEAAALALNDAYDAANGVARMWNIHPI